MQIKNTILKIVQGDIIELAVDAVVNPASPQLMMEGGLAGLLKEKAGSAIEQAAAAQGPVPPGTAIITEAGNFKTKYIIHAVSVNDRWETDEHILRAACANALAQASGLAVEVLALPALGCGRAGFPPKAAAKIMAQEILKAARFNDHPIKEIVICVLDPEIFCIFEQHVIGYITHVQEDLGLGPYLCVDIIIETAEGIVVIERSNPPFGWALPGGFVDCGESLEDAACREAREETGLELENLQQIHTYSDPRRDPRFHTVSTVFAAQGRGEPRFGDDAKGLRVVPAEEILNQRFAFDHNEIIQNYLKTRKGWGHGHGTSQSRVE